MVIELKVNLIEYTRKLIKLSIFVKIYGGEYSAAEIL